MMNLGARFQSLIKKRSSRLRDIGRFTYSNYHIKINYEIEGNLFESKFLIVFTISSSIFLPYKNNLTNNKRYVRLVIEVYTILTIKFY